VTPVLVPQKFTYKIKDGEAIITGFDKEATDIAIPETIEGCPVTGIGEGAFEACSHLSGISIPDGVTSIGNHAFSECHSLKDVDFTGTKGQWDNFSIESHNDPLLNANITFGA